MRLVEYFRKEYDLDIKDEEADLFLTSLATLYDALAKRAAPPADPLMRERAAGSDLISPHSCKKGFHS